MAAVTKKQVETFDARWRPDPIGFQVQWLDVKPEHVWPKMVEVAEAVRDHQRVAVKAGHGVSKTYEVARLALWFLYCFRPSTVITTAPTHLQVEEILWREIRAAHAGAKKPLGGTLTRTKLDLGEKWFALGFSTRPDAVTQQATRFQGFHNDYVLVIFDEAAGILPQIWRAARSLVNTERCRFLAIGNPTSPFGDFADCFTSPTSGWRQVSISVTDTPNFQEGREVIPGVSGVEYEREIADRHGRDSNEYKIRVLGELPSYSEGTFYGPALAKLAAEGAIGDVPWDSTVRVHTAWDTGDMNTAVWFFQCIQDRIHWIDYYEDNEGRGLPAYAKMLQDKPYVYGQHFCGPDVDGSNRKSFQTGCVTLEVADGLGVHFRPVPSHQPIDRIRALQAVLAKSRFDAVKCKAGLACLANYRKEKDEARSTEDRPAYKEHPLKDWTRHGADAAGHGAVQYRMDTIDGERLGYPHPISTQAQFEAERDQNWDIMSFGRPRRRQLTRSS